MPIKERFIVARQVCLDGKTWVTTSEYHSVDTATKRLSKHKRDKNKGPDGNYDLSELYEELPPTGVTNV